MKPACLRAEALLQRKSAGISSAEGLQLEEHLLGCAQCRHTANMLAGLRSLHAEQPVALSDVARRRSIARALDAAPMVPVSTPRRASVPLLLAAAAVLVLVGAWALRSREPSRVGEGAAVAVADKPAAPPTAAGDRVLSGVVETAAGARNAGQTLLGDATLTSTLGARIALAHATVELRPETQARWDGAGRALRLERGSVAVEVDPASQRSFEVLTEHFDVQVLGTGFVVDARSVTLLHGRVRVTVHDTHQQMILDVEHPRYELIAQKPARTQRAPSTRKPDVQALLDEARVRLAAHDVAGARETVQRAQRLATSRAEHAEASSLQAECSLVAGRFAEARAAFLSVSDRFAPSATAEAALFAAARIEADHGGRPLARSLFARYLARYPHGSLAAEARKRAASLVDPPR